MLEGLQDGILRTDRNTWAKLRRETARLTRLVNDLSELWRAEARQLSLHLEVVDVVEVTRDVLDAMRGTAGTRQLQLDVPVRMRAHALADRDRLAQILGNLVSNAIRYAPSGPIEITVRPGRDLVEVAVRDRGPGLTTDQLYRVFERFYRVDPSRSRSLGGSGVGLAISAALAEAMGGRLYARSEGPGTGSTFTLELPSGREA
jgi:signal transduction histidine kinase